MNHPSNHLGISLHHLKSGYAQYIHNNQNRVGWLLPHFSFSRSMLHPAVMQMSPDDLYHPLATFAPSQPLVGGIPTPLKNMSSSVGMMTFPTYGKLTFIQTTNQPFLCIPWIHPHDSHTRVRSTPLSHHLLGDAFSLEHVGTQVSKAKFVPNKIHDLELQQKTIVYLENSLLSEFSHLNIPTSSPSAPKNPTPAHAVPVEEEAGHFAELLEILP